jgi:hypothetical protein
MSSFLRTKKQTVQPGWRNHCPSRQRRNNGPQPIHERIFSIINAAWDFSRLRAAFGTDYRRQPLCLPSKSTGQNRIEKQYDDEIERVDSGGLRQRWNEVIRTVAAHFLMRDSYHVGADSIGLQQ